MEVLHIIEREGDRVVAQLPEDVDLYTTPSVVTAVDALIDSGCRHLVLDATHTLHMDSTGVSALVGWYQRLDGAGGSLGVTGLHDGLLRMFTILGLDTVMSLKPGPATTA
ncbi:STAS domain-containing protein [Streptomyces sp. D2-8]|uniref:STAS domain-containing protein n=1 Tax=Streptomyces sp. D2-8 TaxID=2707767 RepID=UPI0020C15C71|nr:STAS domain-containing protein [Streptomyces sp. D2-8]MCK8432999.1 STAS domain-containing protein [Streptomyces sp. D2-8]